ncbi:hypothetical protein NW762_007983 [Fusarium torreyae]|uniref:GST N-terminal domain-containing protein n=1 Tax=Fusarium torreyae TaxID=1237075 RepID=A0A9W8VG54_9HYPO|nr:hypothetical protein NW762_007983 [Fusarium torreyae]
MSDQTQPEIILYDLACTKNVCFSPVAWKTRLMLNYKGISYKTIFLEFPDIEPTLKGLGIAPHDPSSGSHAKYTVPAIQHVPTNTYIMDSKSIAEFLAKTYPEPPLPLTSELGSEIETKARSAMGPAFYFSVTPRELLILSPRSQEYFRSKSERRLGNKLESLLEGDKEEKAWEEVRDKMRGVGELMQTNKEDGPFILGARPSYTDFLISASLQSGRTIDEGIFQRCIEYPGFKEIYEACLPWMEKKD